MPRVEESVHLGPGYMYVTAWTAGAAETYTELTSTDEVDTAPGGNWVDVGFSEDGWNFVAENEYGFWTPAELVDPIATVKDSQELHFRGVAAEFTLENMQIALGGGTITIEDAGSAGTVDAIHKYVPPASTGFDFFSALFRVEGEGTNYETGFSRVRDFYVPKCISIAAMDVAHTKGANPSLVAIDLQALKPTAIAAQATLEITEIPLNNETFTIGTRQYTLETTLTDSPDFIAIGGSEAQAKLNIVAALNDTGTPGTDYGTGTTVNADVSAAAFVVDDMVITALVAGSAGNAIALAEAITDVGWDGVFMGETRRGYGDIFETYEQAEPV